MSLCAWSRLAGALVIAQVLAHGCDDGAENADPSYPPPLAHRVEPARLLPRTALRVEADGLVASARTNGMSPFFPATRPRKSR